MHMAGGPSQLGVDTEAVPALLADKLAVPRAEVGDLVTIFQSGAYGFTASPPDFLGHPQPAEVLV